MASRKAIIKRIKKRMRANNAPVDDWVDFGDRSMLADGFMLVSKPSEEKSRQGDVGMVHQQADTLYRLDAFANPVAACTVSPHALIDSLKNALAIAKNDVNNRIMISVNGTLELLAKHDVGNVRVGDVRVTVRNGESHAVSSRARKKKYTVDHYAHIGATVVKHFDGRLLLDAIEYVVQGKRTKNVCLQFKEDMVKIVGDDEHEALLMGLRPPKKEQKNEVQ